MGIFSKTAFEVEIDQMENETKEMKMQGDTKRETTTDNAAHRVMADQAQIEEMICGIVGDIEGGVEQETLRDVLALAYMARMADAVERIATAAEKGGKQLEALAETHEALLAEYEIEGE
jgi:DNA polymerase III sliding clamp (beta) subunit (PCNA family)